jgi:hypothetical protein
MGSRRPRCFGLSRSRRIGDLLFVRERIGVVSDVVPRVHETINALDGQCAEIFRGDPCYKAPDLEPMLRQLIESADLGPTS